MLSLPPIVLAGLTGFISGLVLSIPVGPINLTILNEGARRGFKWALLIGLGATLMETVYCFVAFTGFAAFFTRGYIQEIMQLCGFVFMFFISLRFLFARSVLVPALKLGAAAGRFETRVGTRLHPSSAFMTGLVQVMGNLGVFVWWVILAATFISREWVAPDWPGKLACVGGVTLGVFLWYLGLSWVVSIRQGKISEKTLLRMQRFSGVCLLVIAGFQGVLIVWKMHQKAL